MKRNWRHTDPPIYVPPEPIHLWWLLPLWVAIGFLTFGAVMGALYLIIWSLV